MAERARRLTTLPETKLRELLAQCPGARRMSGSKHLTKSELVRYVLRYQCSAPVTAMATAVRGDGTSSRRAVTLTQSVSASPIPRSKEDWRTFRLALYHAIQRGEIKLKACSDMFRWFSELPRVPGKNSASDSIVMLGDLNVPVHGNNSVVIKVGFQNITGDNGDEVERFVYERIVNPLIKARHTPHLVAFVGVVQCQSFDPPPCYQSPSGKSKTPQCEFNAQYDQLNGGSLNMRQMRALITERATGITLDKWLETERSISDLHAVLFQIIYTLTCFNEIGLQHHDMHLGNVFIDTMSGPSVRSFTYVTSTRAYVVRTQWVAKFYDFDLATKHATPLNSLAMENTRLEEFCPEYGICNQPPSPKYDCFKILFAIYHRVVAKRANLHMVDFIEGVMDKILVQLVRVGDRLAFPGSLCLKNTANPNAPCQVIHPTDKELMPNAAILELPVFSHYDISRADPATLDPQLVFSLPSVPRARRNTIIRTILHGGRTPPAHAKRPRTPSPPLRTRTPPTTSPPRRTRTPSSSGAKRRRV